ncbi:glutathione S-transferase family protein [Lacibacterium aquatile]|uniref:glutathione transferase n=1 Tax=Lacibacterium aquatile TaxID=1168082 RepID=A0ABW5DVW9_9PROT
MELVSFDLCPYVQRAAIALAEKQIAFTRTSIDLSDKPDWFKTISPLGKVPLLKTPSGDVLFESAAICEYLDETQGPQLHPADPVIRAKHRAWMEFASATLSDIGGYYSASDAQGFDRKAGDLRAKFEQIEKALDATGPFFAGAAFSLVDAAFAPIFRYFEVFERFYQPAIFDHLPKVRSWRSALVARPSVSGAVVHDFSAKLERFLVKKQTHLSTLIAA